MTITPKHQLELEAGEQVRGTFWIEGKPNESAPGVLRWSIRDGAELMVIGTFGEELLQIPQPSMTIHGRSSKDGTDFALPGARLFGTTFGSGRELRFLDSTLILYDHFSSTSEWKRLVFRTAHLHEWLPITGFQTPTIDRRAGQLERYSENWKAPRGLRVTLPDARLRFGARMATELSWQPERSIRTALDVLVTAQDRATLASLHERFAIPLANLLVLASGRPDRVIYEAAVRGRKRAVVLRRGIEVVSREWRPGRELLFYARHLPDFRRAIRDWFALHRRCSPAIEVFAYAINHQPTYSEAELLNIAVALETYHREIHQAAWSRTWRQQNPTAKKRDPNLIERIDHLQRISGVPESATGLDQANRELLVASRNHYAHLSAPAYGYTPEDVRGATPDSIRRGFALMQACLLRELGFSPRDTENRLSAHYAQWPVPQ